MWAMTSLTGKQAHLPLLSLTHSRISNISQNLFRLQQAAKELEKIENALRRWNSLHSMAKLLTNLFLLLLSYRITSVFAFAILAMF